MIFSKKDNLIGLDIGSRSIKAAEVGESKRGRELKRFGITEIPHGAIEDGTINDPETLAESIRQLRSNIFRLISVMSILIFRFWEKMKPIPIK
jgi:Tfp pilus assembly PilM family ATPase